ncbi:hypothetical protein LTR70_004408 [Exophiala xenobiotica]|uniref:Uncharacterized protein n=1 Tax=Lithohypha guttulata TaxID=1690604 RepID=A0ABR0KDE7_9EURO|nr:hypothetical protein LTR24_003887 [Lithohypha guttulata]KAK5320830.1 hypothetical protein LTR70_004408 [Exophiala xenobiotica]
MAGRSDYKQDLIVSIRYRNDLPPPPMPPKLLEIDTGGLQQYLDPGFAASIAKREEPNIEADAEGGMPIDVIGLYGYFEGDESAIMAPEIAPPLDPEDEALMLTPDQLKAGGVISSTSTFLRKTQYMTATSGLASDPLRSAQPRARRDSKPKPQVMARDDKENIKRNIQKAFNLAYPASRDAADGVPPATQAERTAWERPIHPHKKNLKPVAFYPVLPDFEAATAIGSSWNLMRFDKPPLPAVRGHRDNRIDAAFLMTQEHPEKKAQWEAAKAAFDADPNKYEDPGNQPMVWSLLLPRDQGSTSLIRKVFNSQDPEHNDPSLLARVGESSRDDNLRIPLDRARFYSNAQSQDKEVGRHTRQVVLTLKEKDSNSSPEAHYYPIGQANLLKSDRGKLGQQRRPAAEEVNIEDTLADQVMVLPRDPNALELANRYYNREEFDPAFEAEYKEISAAAEAMQGVEAEPAGKPADGENDAADDVDMAGG